jgi:hypothetical protein
VKPGKRETVSEFFENGIETRSREDRKNTKISSRLPFFPVYKRFPSRLPFFPVYKRFPSRPVLKKISFLYLFTRNYAAFPQNI